MNTHTHTHTNPLISVLAGAQMAYMASLALPSSICGTKVARGPSLVAHCTLHGTEGMAICFSISWGPEEPRDLKAHNFHVGRNYKCKFSITHFTDGLLKA